jgi:SAM-dependent methyltransferase
MRFTLRDLVQAGPSQKGPEGAGKLPWDDPDFSERMLAEHLSQRHDLASRRLDAIDRHVTWLHHTVAGGQPGKVLDLGCGPGLYTERLAALGHECAGIDFSPASIRYATQQADKLGLDCTYRLDDLRSADFGADFNLILFLFGELNTFTPAEAEVVLHRAAQSLADHGALVLEVHTIECVRAIGTAASTWQRSEGGLFSAEPHLVLTESIWDEQQARATEHHWVMSPEEGEVSRYASTLYGYTDPEYDDLLRRCGLIRVARFGDLEGADRVDGDLEVITATHPDR